MRGPQAGWVSLVLGVLSACGGAVATPSQDGSIGDLDGGMDASSEGGEDAGADAVSGSPIVVQLFGEVVEGAVVVYQDANGIVLDSVVAEVDGRIEHKMVPGLAGGKITVVFPKAPTSLVTVEGVLPGDVLPINDFQHAALPSIPIEIKVPTLEAADSYLAYIGGCQLASLTGGVSTTITGMIDPHCARSGVFSVYVEPSPSPAGTFLAKSGNALAGTGTTNVDLSTNAWTADTDTINTLMTGRVGTAASLSTVLTEIADQNVSYSRQLNVPIAGDGTYSQSFAVPKGYAQAHDIWWTGVEGNETREVIDRITASVSGGPMNLSLHSDVFPPRISSIVLSELETARPSTTWVHASPSPLDGQLVTLQAEDSSFSWRVITAPGSTSLRIPELPNTVTTKLTFGGAAQVKVTAVASDGLNGYDEFRPIAASLRHRSDFLAGRIQAAKVTLASRTFPPP